MMTLSPTGTAFFSHFEGLLQRTKLKNRNHPAPAPLKFSLTGYFIGALLIGVFVLTGSLTLFAFDNPQPAQAALRLATANEITANTAGERQLDGEHQFQNYSVWLQASHARAARYGQEAPLSDQF